MRKIMIAVLCCCVGAAVASAGETTPVEGVVKKVTVYTSGSARVTREAKVDLPKGRSVLLSQPLPARADVSSVQASVKIEGAEVVIESVETRRELAERKDMDARRAEHNRALEEMEDALFAIQQEIATIEQTVQSHTETLQLLEKMRQQAADTAREDMRFQQPDSKAWEQAIAFTFEKSQAARAAMRHLAAERRATEKRQRRKYREFEELRAKGPNQEYETRAYVTLSANAAAAGTLRLTYNVGGAAWMPSYRATADTKNKTVALDLFGTVYQTSGEDWKGVALSLSTARPDIGTDIPVLLPWYLNIGGLPGQTDRTAGYAGIELEEAPMTPETNAPEEVPPPPTVRQSAGVATVFTASAPATIPADGQHHRIPVSSVTSPIELEHVAIPKIRPHAYLKATMQNKADYPLLPGVVEVVVKDTYVGRGMMQRTAPGEKIRLSLGIDEQVRISLDLIDVTSDTTWRGNRVRTTNTFRIQATSYAGETINLTVYDQLPVSKNPDVVIDYDRVASQALRGAEFPGQLKWQLVLEPKDTKTIEFAFTIEYPEAMKQQLKMNPQAVNYKFNLMKAKKDALGNKVYRQQMEDEQIEQSIEF